jgi:hypothetical protein
MDTTKRREVRRRADRLAGWRRAVAEQEAGGQTIAAFCRERGLPVWKFCYWRKALQRPEGGVGCFVELKDPGQLRLPGRVWVEAGAWRVFVETGAVGRGRKERTYPVSRWRASHPSGGGDFRAAVLPRARIPSWEGYVPRTPEAFPVPPARTAPVCSSPRTWQRDGHAGSLPPRTAAWQAGNGMSRRRGRCRQTLGSHAASLSPALPLRRRQPIGE